MTKTKVQSRYSPRDKIISQTILDKPNYSTSLPTNLQNFDDDFQLEIGFIVNEDFSKTL